MHNKVKGSNPAL